MLRLIKKIDARFDHLNEKIELNSFKIDTLNIKIEALDVRLSKKIDDVEENLTKKIDVLSADISSHRSDTEAHHGIYRVKES